jgi:outer membrane protein OmpA-like peptidoglycan-associated protein
VAGPAASGLITDLASATDDARQGTLELERGLREDLRNELEKTRQEAADRQNQLYQALQQIQGKYAQITRDARGTIISLADILFDFNKATLKRDVEFSLVRVATILNQFPEMKIAVEGHTDNVGTAEYNLDLSKRRAQAVADFLASQGVSADRMTVAGYGMTRPVADNSTEEGRQKNRRVDLVVQD